MLVGAVGAVGAVGVELEEAAAGLAAADWACSAAAADGKAPQPVNAEDEMPVSVSALLASC